MLKLVMAVTDTGHVTLEKNDRMTWTGPDDKAAFRLLTMTGSRVMGASAQTRNLMPTILDGRKIVSLSTDKRRGQTLYEFSKRFPGAALIGGQTIALEAIANGLLTEVHLCVVPTPLHTDVVQDGAIKEILRRNLRVWNWDIVAKTKVGRVTVEHWLLP